MTKEYWTLVITMIVGGLTYSILSFSYMQSVFATKDELASRQQASERYDGTVKDRLDRIEAKLDSLIQRSGK